MNDARPGWCGLVGLAGCLVLSVGCGETTDDGGGGGTGGADDCEPQTVAGSSSCTLSLACFCETYHCEAGLDPFGGEPDNGYVAEYAGCDRRLYVSQRENPVIWHLVDTTDDSVVGARYGDDMGACGVPHSVYAGELVGAGYPEPADCGITSCEAIGAWSCP